MSLSTGTVVFEDATLKAVELVAETMTLNNFSVSSTTSLQQATNTGNVTTNTVEFTNPTTAFVTTANVEVGTANLFVDTTTGRVGVGTGSPITKFHVVDANPEITLKNTGGSSNQTSGMRFYGTFANFTDTGTRRVADIQAGFRNGSSQGTWGYQYMSFHVGKGSSTANDSQSLNDERMCITGTGNVGIGKTNPGATLDVNGYVKNTNPVFSAYRTGSAFSTANGTVVFDTKTEDSTNSYNNTNGRFTAPIEGYYMFSVYAMHTQADYLWLSFYKNGAIVNLANPYGNGTELVNVSGTTTMYLSQGDYVYVVLRGGTFFGNNNCHNGFCGHFLG